ncbi:hypothetical protein B0H14DRAFT_3594392 [Mycena olivaceomarginata]|nr:hypothetical protein B0H14DRAFT_3594392 [Mycena olivaceomarginata]
MSSLRARGSAFDSAAARMVGICSSQQGAEATNKDSPRSKICQFFVFGCGRVDPRVYDVGVGTDDERVLEDSGWWRRCPVFLGSGSTLPKNERIAARRWLIRPRIRPESKLQDKCFERTAALDVENTMCRVNGIGSNAGAWDAADRGGTLSESLGTGRRGGLCDSVTRRLLPAITITTTNVHARKDLPPPRRRPGRERGVSPRGACLPARNGGGVTPAAAVLAQTHAVLTPALADAIWHVARAPAVEKLVDEHRPTFILWIVRGTSSPPSAATPRRHTSPEEDVLRACEEHRDHRDTVLDGGFENRLRRARSWAPWDGCIAAPQNRMRGPLYLFESVINSLWFLRTSVILFLNKIDVFKRNIVSRPSSSPRATTSTSRALGAARAAATAPVTSAVGYSTPFSPPVRPARGRYLRD